LNRLEISLARFESGQRARALEGACPIIPKMRLAIVKQDVFQDLYCAPAGTSGLDLLLSSLHRSGPVGLIAGAKADFWIVKTEQDPECSIWQQKSTDCHQSPLEFYLNLQTKVPRNGEYGHKEPQGRWALNAADIDWSIYDVVICYDAAVPARITRRFPQVAWCYFVGEPCMRSYKSSLAQPLPGYDFFLSQRFRRIRLLPRPANHVIEFPYFAQYYGCFHELFKLDARKHAGRGIFIEGRSNADLQETQLNALRQFGPVRWPSGNIENVLRGLLASKYFLVSEGRKWGNATVEAVACGCLALGSPVGQHHVSLFTPQTTCRSFESALRKIEFFENHPSAFDEELWRQRSLLNRFGFERPLKELHEKYRRAPTTGARVPQTPHLLETVARTSS
jgi:hypothetical protein